MKKRIILSVLVISLVLILTGCGVTPATDEIRIKSIIQNYWLALSNRQYELAKTYCILYGEYYFMVEKYKDIPYVESSIWTFEPYFNYIEMTVNDAIANINLISIATICFGDICSNESATIYNWSMHLIKISGTWKLI